ncbi:LysR family transcriptional regulator [Shewanella sp. 202IG2-18]|uniref:LysR family transcriptional regulator n=1 Tax=Parashewanella hymeniacidonis TaxID=2807618 RepID=UPI0019609E29|nr:LysR family transcriptional regulator [Parashewanella hymeniacidonis]MBM7074137.1 LysR family transcriptional regulator [Parashewanella hymeniacidonis]
MDLANKLDLLCDIVQYGSFTKVADLHNVDRSVISKQVKALETELGVRLLNRSTRALSLTSAGTSIYQQAQAVREALLTTKKLAESFHDSPKGKLKVTGYTAFGQQYLRKAINQFLLKYPETEIELVLDDKRFDIINEGFDIAFRIGPSRDSNLIARKFAPNNLAILAAKSFISEYGRPKTVDELIALPAVIYANNEYNLGKLSIANSANSSELIKRQMAPRFTSNDVGSMLDAVKEGIGYAQFAMSTITRPIEEDNLTTLLTDHKLADAGEIYALYPHRNQTPLTNLFLDEVKCVIGTPPIWKSYIDNYANLY